MTIQVPNQPYTIWKIFITILHCVAIAMSFVRVWLRYRSNRMWWDDYLVVLPMLVEIFYCITLLVAPPPGPTLESISKASNYWLTLFPSLTVVWSSRICFLLLLARLFPPRHANRIIALALAVVFALTYLTQIALFVPRCDGVHRVPPPSSAGKKGCRAPPKIYATLVFGLAIELCDLILVIWPILMLCKVKLSRPQDRPLVRVSLGCSIFTLLLVVTIIVFRTAPIAQDYNFDIVVAMLAHMTAAVALIACNMPVVACAAYRACQHALGVPLGTAVQMPNASPVDGSPPPVLKSKTTGDTTRLTYDDLTRISLSMSRSDDMSELSGEVKCVAGC